VLSCGQPPRDAARRRQQGNPHALAEIAFVGGPQKCLALFGLEATAGGVPCRTRFSSSFRFLSIALTGSSVARGEISQDGRRSKEGIDALLHAVAAYWQRASRMYSRKSKVLVAILFTFAVAVVVYSSVYLSVDAASLPAQVPSNSNRRHDAVWSRSRNPGPPAAPFQHPLQMLLIFLSTLESCELSIRMASSPCIGCP
jgi:hypothetical protein